MIDLTLHPVHDNGMYPHLHPWKIEARDGSCGVTLDDGRWVHSPNIEGRGSGFWMCMVPPGEWDSVPRQVRVTMSIAFVEGELHTLRKVRLADDDELLAISGINGNRLGQLREWEWRR